MSATADMVALVRLKINEPDDSRFTDEQIETIIEQFPVRDADDLPPSDDDWAATYDLNRAASDLWLQKASIFQEEYDFNADGANFHRSQRYNNAIRQAALYNGRSYATVTLVRSGADDD